MICQSCGKETTEGKFCQYCGEQLETGEVAASAEQASETPEQDEVANEQQVQATESSEETTQSQPDGTEEKEPNEFVEKVKEEASKFGTFFTTLIKKPRDAKNFTGEHFISGIVMIVILSLFVTLNHYYSAEAFLDSSIASLMGSSDPSFVDQFLVPLLKHLLMFGLLAVIVFGASKAVAQDVSIKDILAKYGAYLVPFTLLYLVGILFSLVNITLLSIIVLMFSLISVVMLIPILIISEQTVKGFDLVYTIICVNLISFVIFGYLSTNVVSSVLNMF